MASCALYLQRRGIIHKIYRYYSDLSGKLEKFYSRS